MSSRASSEYASVRASGHFLVRVGARRSPMVQDMLANLTKRRATTASIQFRTPGEVIHNLEARAGRWAQGRGDNERRQTGVRHRRTEAIASDWKSRCGYAVVPDSPMWLCVYQALLVQVANELTSESGFPPMRTLRMGARMHCQCD